MTIASQNQSRGFSLVETTLAFGIVTVTLLSMVAMMSGVINTAGETADRFATARIFQGVAQEFQMKDWDTISKIGVSDTGLRYYDEKGEEVNKTDFEAVYAARIHVIDAPTLPGISSDAQTKLDQRTETRQESRRVKVEVSNRLQVKDPFAEDRFLTTFSTLLVKLDQ